MTEHQWHNDQALGEAAMRRMGEEDKQLRAENERLRKAMESLGAVLSDTADREDNLRAENERLESWARRAKVWIRACLRGEDGPGWDEMDKRARVLLEDLGRWLEA